jgi:beta-lactamase regulating signal transducer with metallopeptidase domain
MTALELHSIASYSSMRLIDSLAEGLVVGLFAAVLLRLARRQNAGTRFAIAFAALLALAMLPIARALWPNAPVASHAPTFMAPESWALYLFSVWAVIASVLMTRVVRSVWHLRKTRNECVPLEPALVDSLVAETLLRKRGSRRVALCTSDQVRVPTAIGLTKPAIVIPRWAIDELSHEELNQVVLHELAHLRRWDDWTNLAQQVVKALFFFHPAVWWIERKLALEREVACDDAVLAETESPRAYAECLAHLAERSFLQKSVSLAQALVGRVAQTSQRVAQILDVNRPESTSRIWKPAVSAMVGVGMLCSVWVARTPELVGFKSNNMPSVEFSRSLQERVTVPATNAKLVQRSTPEQTHTRAIPAKLSSKPAQRKVRGPQLAIRAQNSGSLVHLSSMNSKSAPISETLFVFIESGQNDFAEPQVYRVQMWRVTVLPASDAVGSKTPSKKT